MTAQFKGSIVALVSPMHEDGSLDYESFDALLEWHIDRGTDGLVIAGTTGESATLSQQERQDLVARAVQFVNGRLPVIAGAGTNNTAESVQNARAAAEAGAQGCMLVVPYYNKPSQEGLYQHFKQIAEAVDIPHILYNVPSRTACDLGLETVLRLAEVENICGIKDASGDVQRGRELVQRLAGLGRQKAPLAVYSGEDALNIDLLRGGAAGVISVTANVAPESMARLCEAALAGDFNTAAAMDEKLAGLHQQLFCQSNPMPVKWALQRMGRIQGGIRLPLTELQADFHIQVRDAMQQAGVVLK